MCATNLPPVGVLPVHNVQYLSFGKSQSCFFTGNEVVCFRVVLEMRSQIHLKTESAAFE